MNLKAIRSEIGARRIGLARLRIELKCAVGRLLAELQTVLKLFPMVGYEQVIGISKARVGLGIRRIALDRILEQRLRDAQARKVTLTHPAARYQVKLVSLRIVGPV